MCFVCTGNICRSPMAATVFCAGAAALGFAGLEVDSAGVAAEVGFDIDRRARKALETLGYTPIAHRARQFEPRWLDERDLVVAMDRGELRWLERHSPTSGHRAEVRLLLSFVSPPLSGAAEEVPDPYYGDERRFEACLELIVAGCDALLSTLAGASSPAEVRSRDSQSSY